MMRRSLAAIILAATLAGPAIAQEDPFLPSDFGAEQGMSPIDFDAARMSYFNQADTNGDLYLSHDEIDHAGSQGNSALFEGSDMDGDGKISLDEFIASGNDLFTHLDANGDGVLSAGEM